MGSQRPPLNRIWPGSPALPSSLMAVVADVDPEFVGEGEVTEGSLGKDFEGSGATRVGPSAGEGVGE